MRRVTVGGADLGTGGRGRIFLSCVWRTSGGEGGEGYAGRDSGRFGVASCEDGKELREDEGGERFLSCVRAFAVSDGNDFRGAMRRGLTGSRDKNGSGTTACPTSWFGNTIGRTVASPNIEGSRGREGKSSLRIMVRTLIGTKNRETGTQDRTRSISIVRGWPVDQRNSKPWK